MGRPFNPLEQVSSTQKGRNSRSCLQFPVGRYFCWVFGRKSKGNQQNADLNGFSVQTKIRKHLKSVQYAQKSPQSSLGELLCIPSFRSKRCLTCFLKILGCQLGISFRSYNCLAAAKGGRAPKRQICRGFTLDSPKVLFPLCCKMSRDVCGLLGAILARNIKLMEYTFPC